MINIWTTLIDYVKAHLHATIKNIKMYNMVKTLTGTQTTKLSTWKRFFWRHGRSPVGSWWLMASGFCLNLVLIQTTESPRWGSHCSTELVQSCSSYSGFCAGSRASCKASLDFHRSSQDPPLESDERIIWLNHHSPWCSRCLSSPYSLNVEVLPHFIKSMLQRTYNWNPLCPPAADPDINMIKLHTTSL